MIKIPCTRAEEISAPPAFPLANSSVMGTPTVHCVWEDETMRVKTGHPSSNGQGNRPIAAIRANYIRGLTFQ